MDSKTRLFYVVDSIEDNEEIFNTLENALEFKKSLKIENKPRLYVAQVKNAYQDELNNWTYDDQADTFKIVAQL